MRIFIFLLYINTLLNILFGQANIIAENLADINGLTLIQAIKTNNFDKAKELVNFANINIQDATGNTPLIWAAILGNYKVVELLLEHNGLENNINVNLQNNSKDTALIEAAFNNNTKILKLLLDYGAKVNLQNSKDDTALMYACQRNNLQAVKLLLQYNADANLKNYMDNTALVWCKNLKILELLLKHNANVNNQNKLGYTPLMWFAKENRIDSVKLLLEYNADINIKSHQNKTAIDLATQCSNIDIVYILRNINSVEQDINNFKNQSKELKILLTERWLNSNQFNKLEKIEPYLPEFYKLYLNYYNKIKTNKISNQEIKQILTGNAQISKLAKINKTFKARYIKLYNYLSRLYNKNSLINILPKELVTKEIFNYLTKCEI